MLYLHCRFYAIVCPLSTGKASQIMKILLGTAWIVSILSALPQVSVSAFKLDFRFNKKYYSNLICMHKYEPMKL